MNADSPNNKPVVFKVQQTKANPKLKRMQWSKKHDELLTELTKKFKGHSWAEISKVMNERFTDTKFTSKKCRARWKNCINPELSKQYLNDAEELLLVAYHSAYKNKWSKISKRLPHRNSNILRNSFYGSLRKTIQQIVSDKKISRDVNPLEFIQALYICIFICELLDLPKTPAHKNPIVPLYIYLYVKEKKINKVMCGRYVDQFRDKLLTQFPLRKKLQSLQGYSYQLLATNFFNKIVIQIKQSVTQNAYITDEFLLDMIEKAFFMDAQPSPSPPTSYPPFSQTSPCGVMPQKPSMCVIMNSQVLNSPLILGSPAKQPMYHIGVNQMFPVFPQGIPMFIPPYQLPPIQSYPVIQMKAPTTESLSPIFRPFAHLNKA